MIKKKAASRIRLRLNRITFDDKGLCFQYFMLLILLSLQMYHQNI